MTERACDHCTAFAGMRRIACGDLTEVALKAKAIIDQGEDAPILIFDDATAKLIELDFRGSGEDVLRRLPDRAPLQTGGVEPEAARGPGRPKLGVVAREVTLLPRHWQWLGSQPGGASVALRKLVEDARRANSGKDRVRGSQEAAYRFMSVLAGDAPGFEEAVRALFAGDRGRFDQSVEGWPVDVRDHAMTLARVALGSQPAG
jgi:uncharacterized protein